MTSSSSWGSLVQELKRSLSLTPLVSTQKLTGGTHWHHFNLRTPSQRLRGWGHNCFWFPYTWWSHPSYIYHLQTHTSTLQILLNHLSKSQNVIKIRFQTTVPVHRRSSSVIQNKVHITREHKFLN